MVQASEGRCDAHFVGEVLAQVRQGIEDDTLLKTIFPEPTELKLSAGGYGSSSSRDCHPLGGKVVTSAVTEVQMRNLTNVQRR